MLNYPPADMNVDPFNDAYDPKWPDEYYPIDVKAMKLLNSTTPELDPLHNPDIPIFVVITGVLDKKLSNMEFATTSSDAAFSYSNDRNTKIMLFWKDSVFWANPFLRTPEYHSDWPKKFLPSWKKK